MDVTYWSATLQISSSFIGQATDYSFRDSYWFMKHAIVSLEGTSHTTKETFSDSTKVNNFYIY